MMLFNAQRNIHPSESNALKVAFSCQSHFVSNDIFYVRSVI